MGKLKQQNKRKRQQCFVALAGVFFREKLKKEGGQMSYHHALGVYRVILQEGQLGVIHKQGGPYHGRYDLPGGSQESGETLEMTLLREVKEETGLSVSSFQQLGAVSFIYPWRYQETTMNHHLGIFYQVLSTVGMLQEEVSQFAGQDSLGACWLELADLTWENASPLVMRAKEFVSTGIFSSHAWQQAHWEVYAEE